MGPRVEPLRLGDGEAADVGAQAAHVGIGQAVEDVNTRRRVVEGIVDVGCLGHDDLGTQLRHRLGSHVVDAAIDRRLVDGADEVGELLGLLRLGAEVVNAHDAVVAQQPVGVELAGGAVAGFGQGRHDVRGEAGHGREADAVCWVPAFDAPAAMPQPLTGERPALGVGERDMHLAPVDSCVRHRGCVGDAKPVAQVRVVGGDVANGPVLCRCLGSSWH